MITYKTTVSHAKYYKDLVIVLTHWDYLGNMIIGGVISNGEIELITLDQELLIDWFFKQLRILKDKPIPKAVKSGKRYLPIYTRSFTNIVNLFGDYEDQTFRIGEDANGMFLKMLRDGKRDFERHLGFLEFRSINELIDLDLCKRDTPIGDELYAIQDISEEELRAQMKKELFTVYDFVKVHADTVGGINNFRMGKGSVGCRFVERMQDEHGLFVIKKQAQLTAKNFPTFEMYQRICYDGMRKFSANSMLEVKQDTVSEQVVSYDFDSSFWSVIGAYKLPMQKVCYIGKDRDGDWRYFSSRDLENYLRDKKHFTGEYCFTCRATILSVEPKNKLNNWLLLRDTKVDLGYVTSSLLEEIRQDYDFRERDLILTDITVYASGYMSNEVFNYVYQTLHERKSALKKTKGAEYTIIKLCGNVIHGVAQKQSRIKHKRSFAYQDIKRDSERRPAEYLLSPQQSFFVYQLAACRLLQVLRRCDMSKVVYFDTDCIKTTQSKAEMDKIAEQVNAELIDRYRAAKRNIHRMTAEEHVLGFFEYEHTYEIFYALNKKFYIFVEDGKLQSTTSGFRKNVIAQAIQNHFGGTPEEALRAFVEIPEIVLDVGYVLNYQGRIIRCDFDKSVWAKSDVLEKAKMFLSDLVHGYI